MKKNIFLMAFFALLFLAQMAVPVGLIYKSESARSQGDLLRFKCNFYDPKDLFRGNYMQLTLSELSAPYHGGIQSIDKGIERGGSYIRANGRVYVTFTADSEGFAKVLDYSLEEPEGNHLVSERMRYNTQKKELVFSSFGFERYFVNEKDAPLLEKAIAGLRRDDEVYLLVALNGGHYVVEDLVISGKPAREVIADVKKSMREKTDSDQPVTVITVPEEVITVPEEAGPDAAMEPDDADEKSNDAAEPDAAGKSEPSENVMPAE